MERGGLSPESTVTSLLSSSGHLRSSLRPAEHSTSFRFRDQDYYSASAALDAYIADFERSCQSSWSCTGRLVLPDNGPSTPRRARGARSGTETVGDHPVLMESLTERELDFLDLPVSSLHHASNRDRLSMTTDELLSIPHDGSMPVTHTSAFIQGLQSQSGSSWPHRPSSSPGRRICAELSSSHAPSRLNHRHHGVVRVPRSSRGRPGAATFKTLDEITSLSSFQSAHEAAGSEWQEPASRLYRKHGLTSSAADTGSSRKSSVPELSCESSVESWIRCSGRGEESGLCDDHDPRSTAPSWVAELADDDDDDSEQTCSQVGSQQTLRDLRLQFAEHISLLAERKGPDIKETALRDDRIESLIQKADQVLNSLSQRCEGAHTVAVSVRPLDSEELLPTSPPRCLSLTLDSAVAAPEAPSDPGAETLGCGPHGNSIWKQPGPVEALKQMLFRLQAVEVKLQGQHQEASAAPAPGDQLQTAETPGKQQWPEGEAEPESFSGGPSLHRALHHLNRLKLLVEAPGEKPEEEAKDEDEGRYSSTSADICTQQKP